MRPEGRSFAIKSQDVKWEGAVLARPAAELARGKGSFRSSPEWIPNPRFHFQWALRDLMELG